MERTDKKKPHQRDELVCQLPEGESWSHEMDNPIYSKKKAEEETCTWQGVEEEQTQKVNKGKEKKVTHLTRNKTEEQIKLLLNSLDCMM